MHVEFDLHDVLLVGFMELFVAATLMVSPLRRLSGTGRLVDAKVWSLVLSAASAGVVTAASCAAVWAAWGRRPSALELPGAAVLLATVVLMLRRRECSVVGQLFAAAFSVAGLGLILSTIELTARHVGSGMELATSCGLIVLTVAAVVLWSSYASSTVDVLCRIRHPRPTPLADPDHQPFVSIHIAACNEPPAMLIETIARAEAMEYPNFEIVVIDNNTKDDAVWRPVEEYCRHRARVRFVHLDAWPGFKAGACNLALRSHTDERAEIIGLIDADDFVEPSYLRETVPYFTDEHIGFLQTFEGNRDYEGSPYYTACVDSYRAFYLTNMPARHERDSVPFVGTMGLFRRSALEEIGGWNEWCICEDTEASVRVLKGGWSGLYLPQRFGRGVVPPSIGGLHTQRSRWCFGGMQILRLHWRSFLPWDRTRGNRLTASQRHDYLMASLGWTRDLLMVLFSLALLATTGLIASGSRTYLQPVSGADPLFAMALIALASLSTLAVLNQHTAMTPRRAAFFLVVSMGSCFTIARACVQGIVRREGVFVRTPKAERTQRALPRLRHALWNTRWEVALTGCLLAAIGVLVVQRTVHWWLVVMVCVQAIVFLCAPVAVIMSVRAQVTSAASQVEPAAPAASIQSRIRRRGRRPDQLVG